MNRTTEQTLEGYTVLVADDEPGMRMLVTAILQYSGCRLIVKESAEEAWQVLQHERVDVLLTDYRMPGMDGLELLVRTKEQYPTIRVAIISESKWDLAELESYGADAFLSKPFRGEKLQDFVRKVCSRESRRAQGGLSDLLQRAQAERQRRGHF
jgi:CheY-like chemotaxis protein